MARHLRDTSRPICPDAKRAAGLRRLLAAGETKEKETPMNLQSRPETKKTPQPEPAEIKKLILKLRWIGHDSEAERLCAVLDKTQQQEIMLDSPPVTD
jgi:hypothetical protein